MLTIKRMAYRSKREDHAAGAVEREHHRHRWTLEDEPQSPVMQANLPVVASAVQSVHAQMYMARLADGSVCHC